MKRKLGIAFTLIGLSLAGIIVFQGYWTVNAYRVNKKQFERDIDSAMIRAMDQCKKDYFDSMRVVIINRITTEKLLKIDTAYNNQFYSLSFSTANVAPIDSYVVSRANYNFYKNKTPDKNNKIAVVTEMAFYIPDVLHNLTWVLGFDDMSFDGGKTYGTAQTGKPMVKFSAFNFGKPNNSKSALSAMFAGIKQKKPQRQQLMDRIKAIEKELNKTVSDRKGRSAYHGRHRMATRDSAKTKAPPGTVKSLPLLNPPQPASHFKLVERGIYQMPPAFKQADSLKLYRYFGKRLQQLGINAPYSLLFADKPLMPLHANTYYSETGVYEYKYHGWTMLGRMGATFYAKAVFNSPQYAIMKVMLTNILSSLLLILLTGFCFLYVYRTIMEQKNLAELKDDFINNMTHELKTPIATIAVAIEGLQNFNVLNDPEKTSRYLQTSREQLERLNQLVTKVLNVAAFENKEIDLHLQEVDIDEMISNIIASEKLRSAKAVNIVYKNEASIHTISADKLHLNNVLLNLVDNAIKYAGGAVEIAIKVYESDGCTCFSVKDNGIGIPAEHLGSVFDKFYRVPTGNVHNVKGTGLGLSYVKYIVEAHGGSISAKSNVGAGSEFIITLPLS